MPGPKRRKHEKRSETQQNVSLRVSANTDVCPLYPCTTGGSQHLSHVQTQLQQAHPHVFDGFHMSPHHIAPRRLPCFYMHRNRYESTLPQGANASLRVFMDAAHYTTTGNIVMDPMVTKVIHVPKL